MRGQLSMRKISEILRQVHELKFNYRDIASSLNIAVGTVAKYVAKAKAAGLTWPLPEGITEDLLYSRLNLPAGKNSKRTLPDFEYVHKELRRKGITLLLLWREYKEMHPNGLSYSRFCKSYNQYSKSITPVMRQLHKAGEKCFVDYAGMTMPWIDMKTGAIQEAQIFVGALGASQYTFVHAAASQKLPDWIQSHIYMLEFFKGTPKILVPDNLRGAVQKSHIYDPDINANYQKFGEHYGIAIVPARVMAPKDKAKVENAVGCIERSILAPLRHRTFTSLCEINMAIKELLTQFNNAPMQKMKISRAELFLALDKPELKPLPEERYQYHQWAKAKINIDYHFVFDDHYYSVPYRYIHQYTEICASLTTIECFHRGKRIAIHARNYNKYKYTTQKEHMPEAHKTHAEWTPDRMRRWAEKIGPYTSKFIEAMIANRPFPEQAYRACLGVLRLGKKYGNDRLENACSKGLAIGITRYQQIESILMNKMENISVSKPIPNPILRHTNVRGASYYQ